eukprot:434096-Pleurochrysis_carterae.AAC.1
MCARASVEYATVMYLRVGAPSAHCAKFTWPAPVSRGRRARAGTAIAVRGRESVATTPGCPHRRSRRGSPPSTPRPPPAPPR